MIQPSTFITKCRTKYSLNRNKPTSKPKVSSQYFNTNPDNEIINNNPIQTDPNLVTTSYSRKDSEHSIYSHYSHNNNQNPNPFDSNLLCQNCVNQCLVEQKRNRYLNDNNAPISLFEDRFRSQIQVNLNNIIRERELQSKLASDSITRFRSGGKDAFINETENDINTFDKVNNNYEYERARRLQEEKDKINSENLNKFRNSERSAVSSYYDHYVNNKQYRNPFYENIAQGEEMKDRMFKNYQKELLEQIEYKRKLQREMMEKENQETKEQCEQLRREMEKEANERELRDKRTRQQLLNDNLDLIREHERRKIEDENKRREEDEKYQRDYERQREDEEKKHYNDKLIMQKYLKYNLDAIERQRMRKMKEKEEDENYQYNDNICTHGAEEMGTCMRCHCQFPRRFLTINRNFYTNNRK